MGLEPTTRRGLHGAWSPQLVIAQGAPVLEPPRPDLPTHVHFMGDLAAGTRGAEVHPAWAEALDPSRPVIHVSEGTLGRDRGSLVGRTVEALADEPMQIVVGGRHWAERLPDSVIAAEWVPQDLLFPVTDLFVTNVGYGGMMAALSHGVPVLAVPPSTEKWVGAGNMVNSGPGLRLQVKEAAPGVMKRRVGTLLTDPTFRAAARRVAHAMDRAGGAERAAELCETIARP